VFILLRYERARRKTPDIKEIEKEISELLAKKFGSHVQADIPHDPSPGGLDSQVQGASPGKEIDQLQPQAEELIAYLDQYVVKQDQAKAILATKICTHFNRIRRAQEEPGRFDEMAGGIKNNVLMIGPTGVGKTYIIKLIAAKLGVPFVKGDATKFSETGYVGGDVEDLVRTSCARPTTISSWRSMGSFTSTRSTNRLRQKSHRRRCLPHRCPTGSAQTDGGDRGRPEGAP